MPNLDEIIAEARRTLVCPVCGRKYDNSEIKLRGNLDNAYIIQTVCDNGHPPLVTIFIATARDGEGPTFVLHKKPAPVKKISSDDVIDGHLAIEEFNGDFLKLWP